MTVVTDERKALTEIAAIIAAVPPRHVMSSERAIAEILERAGFLSSNGSQFVAMTYLASAHPK